jgi:hypothetical protein
MEKDIVVNHHCLVCGTDSPANYVDITLVTSRTTQSETLVREKLKTILLDKWIHMDTEMSMAIRVLCFHLVDQLDMLESQLQNIRDNLAAKYVGNNGMKEQKSPESQPPPPPASSNSNSSDDDRSQSPVIITTTTRGHKRKQTTQQFVVLRNRFSILNEVEDDNLPKEALRGSKINGKKRNKIMFYRNSYSRDMTSLCKNNVDNSVFGEVRPSAKIRDVLKKCERDCSILDPQDQ